MVQDTVITMTTQHTLSSPDSALHILQWKMSEKCSFVSGFPHDLNAVYFTQDTCVC